MGQHAWLLTATICTELLCILKWSKGLFPEPFPVHVRWGLSILVALLGAYPTVQVSPSLVITCYLLKECSLVFPRPAVIYEDTEERNDPKHHRY